MEHKQERRRTITLDEEDVDKFIDRAIERATEKFYAEVGKNVVKKFFYVVGALVVAAVMGAKYKGWL